MHAALILILLYKIHDGVMVDGLQNQLQDRLNNAENPFGIDQCYIMCLLHDTTRIYG